MRLKILFIFFALAAKLSPILAQSDTVCASNPTANYDVNGSAGSTFSWNTQGNGIILSGQGNDSVRVQWNNVPGSYILTVRETNTSGCKGVLQILNVVVYQPRSTTKVQLCASELPYAWNAGNYNTGGSYSVILTGVAGCDSLATLNLIVEQNPAPPVFRETNVPACPGDTIMLNPGTFAAYLWQDSSTNPGLIVTEGGTYSVEVSNVAGCKARAMAVVKYAVNCDDIYFPNAITPNGDGLNDDFGAVGNLSFVSNYSLSIYNRYGELIFRTTNPIQKWDGSIRGAELGNINCVWFSEYSFKGRPRKMKKGNLLLIR